MTENELEALRRDIFAHLRMAVRRRKHPWRTPTLSTVDLDGFPRARIVVLRQATMDFLELHTDVRSDKFTELKQNPNIAWTFWDRSRQTQIRVRGKVTLHHNDDVSSKVHQELSEGALKAYKVSPAPGTPIPTRYDYNLDEDSSAHFAVIRCYYTEIDWLHLDRKGHERALFRRTPENEWASRFIAP